MIFFDTTLYLLPVFVIKRQKFKNLYILDFTLFLQGYELTEIYAKAPTQNAYEMYNFVILCKDEETENKYKNVFKKFNFGQAYTKIYGFHVNAKNDRITIDL